MARVHRGQAVLVVDDDADLRALVRRMLEPLGYAVWEASSAAEALDAVATAQPAVVLLDVHLPDISGYEVCRRLRDDYDDDIAVVFLSGERTEEYDRTVGILLGADDYIVKPFGSGEFIARVRRAAARSNASHGDAPRLTTRELEVLKLLSSGLGQKKIAQSLFITP